MTPDQDSFWRAFLRETWRAAQSPYELCAFGGEAAQRDALLDLVLTGRKRATCALLRTLERAGLQVPRPGDLSLALDGADRPRCVIETTEVTIRPVIAADDAFAWDEGEGLRSRADWLRQHRAFFAHEAEAEGLFYSDDLPAVFERFRVVWPPRFADAPAQ